MLRRLRGGGTPNDAGDSTATSASDPTPDSEAKARIAAAVAAIGRRYPTESELRAIPAVQELLDAPEPVRAAVLLRLVDRRLANEEGLWSVFSLLCRRKLSLGSADLHGVIVAIAKGMSGKQPWQVGTVVDHVAPVIERSVGDLKGLELETARGQVAGLVKAIEADNRIRTRPATLKRLRAVLPQTSPVPLDAILLDDNLGPAMRRVIEGSPEAPAVLGPFVAHITSGASASRPSATWSDRTRTEGAQLGDAGELIRALLQVALDAEDGTVVYDYTGTTVGSQHTTTRFVSPANETVLRNVVWACGAIRDAEAIPLLRALAQKCIVMIGGQFGYPRSLTVALACPAAIATIAAPGSLTALQGLQRSVRHGSLLREISKAIDALAMSSSVSRSELLETAVERHDLDPSGRRELRVGDWSAVLSVTAAGDVETTWSDASGTERASLPKAVRDGDPAGAKVVTATVKAIRDTIAGERDRLDRQFLEARTWPLATWKDRYLAHPITGALTRGIVWRFSTPDATVVGIPGTDGQTVTDSEGASIGVPDGSDVSLWHPVEATEDEVRAWRARLLVERRRQPLKQVFRELYVVTPAELETRSYSNRFAGHVIRQVQARALMKGRGWKPVALAWWDDGIDHGVARRTLEAYGIRVEFFYDPVADIATTGSDLIPYCATDQVRFFDTATDAAVEIAAVPRLAFSETMRDVDLFVGVTSIGADAQWLDRGERRFDTYWNHWGFGELGQPATIRREVIASLLPALRIADRCTLSERYLEVRGDIRSYRIHLGSSNILMSPADQYLCIVATRHPNDDRLFLPFDDDPTLSLILSKAFMLANDSAITDESILRQIRSG
jgi:hypothetical protein